MIRERLREELARRDRLTAELADLDAAGVVDTEALLRTVSLAQRICGRCSGATSRKRGK